MRASMLVLISVMIASAVALPGAAPAAKGPPSLKVRLSVDVAAKKEARVLRVDVRAPVRASCALSVKGGKRSLTLPALRTTAKQRGAWEWLVPENGPGSKWTFTVTCKKGKASGRARVQALVLSPKEGGGGALAENSSGGVKVGTPVEGFGSGGNRYPVGQCTWWAKERAEWASNGWGNAGTWDDRAARDGFRVDRTPEVGAIAVWDPDVGGSGSVGHVGVVIAVGGGKVRVTEANWPTGSGPRSDRWITASLLKYIHPPGPAGGTQPPPGGGQSFSGVVGVISANGTALVKRDLGQGFEAQSGVGDAVDIALGGTRVGIVTASGTALVKRDFGQPFEAQTAAGDAKAIALSGTRIGVITANGTALVKRDFGQPFEAQTAAGDAKAIALSGTRIGVITANGTALVKRDFGQPFEAQTAIGDAVDIALGAD